jgi:hypothetical protein
VALRRGRSDELQVRDRGATFRASGRDSVRSHAARVDMQNVIRAWTVRFKVEVGFEGL